MNTELSKLEDVKAYIAAALRKTEEAYMSVSNVRSHGYTFGEIKVQLRAAQMKLAEVIQAEPSKTNEMSQTPEPSEALAARPAEVSEAVREKAPSNNLPTWDECKLRCENSDFIAKRVAEGGYGAEHDALLANDLHRFIYEYDDADPYRSEWFMHRLEKAMESIRPACPECASIQAKLDAVMLEYCPDEMTPAQMDNWASHQRRVPPEEEAKINAAIDTARKGG